MNNIEQLLGAILAPAQDVENALQQMALYRFVDTAEGAQLDIIGRIVGQEREGLTDTDYRRYIRARIAANNSNGTIEDVLTVAFLVVYDNTLDYIVDNQGVACLVLRIENGTLTDNLANILIKFLGNTVSAGVRVILEYSTVAPAQWFVWDTPGSGWDNGKFINAIDNSGTEGS